MESVVFYATKEGLECWVSGIMYLTPNAQHPIPGFSHNLELLSRKADA